MVVFLVAALVCGRIPALSHFSPAAYAFFIASAGLVFLKTGVFNLHYSGSNPLQEIALDKLSQFLHIVPVILALTLLVKDDLGSIFIQTGRLKQGLVFGMISFAAFAVLALVMQISNKGFMQLLVKSIPWLLLFIFANAIMEELWFRAIFLNRFGPLVGKTAAILVTALVFGASHINATYEFPGGGLVFGAVVFVLGAVGAYAMFKDNSLIGPVLFHAGYDLLIIVPVINSL